MQDWMGLGLLALGVYLAVSAVRKYRVRTRTAVAAGQIRPEFAVAGEIMRPIILFIVGFFALKISLFYFVLGGSRMLTPLQYGALMLVLAAYVGSLYASTAKRPQPIAATDAAGVAEADGPRLAA